LGRKALETKLKKRRRVKSEMFNPEVDTLQKDRSEGVLPRRKYTPRRKVRTEGVLPRRKDRSEGVLPK